MLNLNSITIRNFMSVGNVTQSLALNGTDLALVLGENLDLGGNDNRNGVGKAQPLHSKIRIPGGWTTMGEISIGDTLVTPDGGTSFVTRIFPQGKKKTYRIHFSDGRTTEACEDHLWKIYSHSFKYKSKDQYLTLTTKEVIAHFKKHEHKKNKSTYYAYVPLCNAEIKDDTDLLLDPYFLGAMLGDGCFSTNGYGFSSGDTEIAENVKLSTPEYLIFEKAAYSVYGYKFTHKKQPKKSLFTKDLKKLGLHGTLSHTKFIPSEYKEASFSQKLSLLQGLLDTDGYVGKQGCLSYTSVSKQLAEDVQYIVRSIGGLANISLKTNCGYKDANGEFIKCKDAYNVSIMYHTPKDLVRLTRKKDLLPGSDYQYKNRKLRIDQIEDIGELESQCIMIDHPDHLYVTDDFVVTHNSSVLNALSYALYGSALTNIRKENLINKTNAKNMLVTLDFDLNNTKYRIERGRKPNIFRVIIDNKEMLDEDSDEAQGDSRNTQLALEESLALSHNMFKNIIALNTYSQPFLSMRAAEQRDIIEQLLGITKLSEKAELLKALVRETKDDIKGEEFRIQAVTEANKQIETNIAALERKSRMWDSSKKKKLEELATKLEQLYKVDIDEEIQRHKDNVETKVKGNEMAQLRKNLASARREESRHSKEITKYVDELEHLEESICPKCEQQLDHDKHTEIKESATKKLGAVRKKGEQSSAQVSEIEAEIAQLQVDELLETFYTDIDEAYNHKSLVDQTKNELENQFKNTNPYSDQVSLMGEAIKEIDFEVMNNLSNKKDHQEFLLKLLTSKDSFIRKKIIDQNLLYLNKRLAYYLEKVGLPHTIKFLSNLEVEIAEYGRTLDFDNLSRGERTRLILSLSWAFRDVYESLNSKINLLFIDELIDSGLDTSGVEAALTVLKGMTRDQKRNVFLISHRDELIGRVDSVVRVVKEGGFTTIGIDDI